jgi:hypothetical protein
MNNNYQPLKYTHRDIETVYKLAQTQSLQDIIKVIASNEGGRELTANDVAYATSVVLNIPFDKIQSTGRFGDIMYAKQLARFVAYYYCRQSGEKIGMDIGGCGHSNFFISHKTTRDMLPFDWKLRENIRMVIGYLRSSNFKLGYKERVIGPECSSTFKRGQPSANPSGRPKGSINKSKDFITTIK